MITRRTLSICGLDIPYFDIRERGATRTAERAVQIEGEDLLGIFTSFVALIYITRKAGGR
jgi:hypothetical protein